MRCFRHIMNISNYWEVIAGPEPPEQTELATPGALDTRLDPLSLVTLTPPGEILHGIREQVEQLSSGM